MKRCDGEALAYVQSWFWDIHTLARAAGLPVEETTNLINAGCAPGVIYALGADGSWWSALAASTGDAPAAPAASALRWYAPGSAWWIRKAVFCMRGGFSPGAAAISNRDGFERDFLEAIRCTQGARLAFAECFSEGGEVAPIRALDRARAEWGGWINGAYGVCLRDFTAPSCVRKESLAAMLKAHLATPSALDLSAEEALSMAQELAALMTPFAPWERQGGTPGKTIDVVLRRFGLGEDLPYPATSRPVGGMCVG